jgi:putative heme-binding domain-containing protein
MKRISGGAGARTPPAWLVVSMLPILSFGSAAKVPAAEPDPALPAGRQLYQTYCWFCHGVRGDGDGPLAESLSPRPRDFIRAEYKIRSTPAGSLPTDDDLLLTITRGIPGTHMPSWHALSEEQRRQLVIYLKSLSKRFRAEAEPLTVPLIDPLADTAEVLETGRRLYEDVKCWLCHGKNGSGDGAVTTALVTEWGLPFRARDLRDGASYKGGSSMTDIYRTISTGFNDTPMSGHRELLDDRERWAVSHYVASLADVKLSRADLLDAGVSWQRGQWVFFGSGRCIVCHKIEGRGVGTRGPDLKQVGVVAATRQKNKSAVRYLFDSITNPSEFLVPDFSAAMPQINQECIFLSPDEIRSLVVYLAAQGTTASPERKAFAELPVPPAPRGTADPPELPGVPELGWQVFNSEKAVCAKCHAVQGRGSHLAPELTNLASIQSVRQITESVLDPSKVLTAGYAQVAVATQDGKMNSGIIVRQNASEVAVADATGKVQVIPRDEIEEIVPQKVSTMPADVAKNLSEAERAHLIAFLVNQQPALDEMYYPPRRSPFVNPLARMKNGPPLGNISHKAGGKWLAEWLKNPKGHDPQTLMPNLELQDDEILAVTAYLTWVADADFPRYSWPALFTRPIENTSLWSSDELDQLDKSTANGKRIWSESRCSICHRVQDLGGLVGHAPDLTRAAYKLRRDWVYYWLGDPRYYFPATQMPHFRFSPEDRRDLVAYLLRSDDFGGTDVVDLPDQPADHVRPPTDLVHRGRVVIERSRCNICHDIPDIDDSLLKKDDWPEPRNDFELLVRDSRCLTCHALNGHGGRFAPELTTVGSRLKAAWIERFLVAPDVVRPLIQQMPKMNLTPPESRMAADYMKRHLIDPEIDPELLADFRPDDENTKPGQELYQAKGCEACHQIGMKGGAVGPALTSVADRLEPGFIYARLKSPQRFNPNVVEPDYGLTNAEALELTRFLLSLTQAAKTDRATEPPKVGKHP